MINSRKISDLHPQVAQNCKDFVTGCNAIGINIIITSTYRDNATQAALYAQGRSVAGPKVTNANAGQSAHNYRLAFDFCPIVHGKASWSDRDLFMRCGTVAEAVGLEWAGRWTKFPEIAHCQNLLDHNLHWYMDYPSHRVA
ncbi:MAG: M15 family metallopeptidase [Methylococcales bacterium]|jgi:peptidoglycan L-alanyl-D-glutamate endopeptidase CwlK